jgi:hypothetical protein
MKKLIGSVLATLGIAGSSATAGQPSSFEQAVQTARRTNEFMPVWELLVNTQFFVIVHQLDAGPQTGNFRFAIFNSPRNEPTVVISEDLGRLKADKGSKAIKMSGAKLIEQLNPEVSILVAIKDGGFGIPKEQVQWLRASMQPAH